MTRAITLARYTQRDELTALWQAAFDDYSDSVHYFFDHRFQPENCLVGMSSGKVMSMLHMLPVEVATVAGRVAAHYIYAAATLPALQGQGYMGALLKAAALCGEWRGQRYSLLLPSDQGLYNFYARHDYLSCYTTKMVTLRREELEIRASSTFCPLSPPNYAVLAQVRNASLLSHQGAALWSAEALSYAVGYYELFGGKLVVSGQGQTMAYALGMVGQSGTCEVLETIADGESFSLLAAELLCHLPAQSYRFRLPAHSSLFGSAGATTPFGMIKSLAGASENLGELCQATPYLGLTLD